MPGRKWTEDELKYLKDNYLIKEHTEIAKDLNRSAPGIRIKSSDLKLTKLHKWTKEETDKIEELYKTVQYQEIGKIIGRTETSVAQYVCGFLEPYDVSDKRRIDVINDDYFKTWSSSMAYILGYFTADGCVTKNSGSSDINYNSFQFYLHKQDREFLEFVVREISPTHHICDSGDFACLRITSKTIIRDLKELGLAARKTGFETVPIIPDEYKFDYLRGLIDGDGWIHNGQNQWTIGLCSASKQFLIDIKSLFNNVGSNINKAKSIFRWDVKRTSEVIYLIENMYYKGYPFGLSRKSEKCNELYSKLKQKETSSLAS